MIIHFFCLFIQVDKIVQKFSKYWPKVQWKLAKIPLFFPDIIYRYLIADTPFFTDIRKQTRSMYEKEEDQHQAGRERLLGDLAANGVEIEKNDETGDRDLAYEIKKKKRGKYVL